MSRILNGVTRAVNLLLGPLAIGLVILVLYLWIIKPLPFAGMMLSLIIFIFLVGMAIGE